MEERDAGREFLRHCLATLAYRCGKVLRDVPEGAARVRAGATSRSALEILAHINDLLEWARWLARGEQRWNDRTPGTWDDEVSCFYTRLETLDSVLASKEPLSAPPESLFQGPIADALTHTGQIALLRRLAGAPVRGENYFKADVAAGRVGREQAAPRREFD